MPFYWVCSSLTSADNIYALKFDQNRVQTHKLWIITELQAHYSFPLPPPIHIFTPVTCWKSKTRVTQVPEGFFLPVYLRYCSSADSSSMHDIFYCFVSKFLINLFFLVASRPPMECKSDNPQQAPVTHTPMSEQSPNTICDTL